jgi:uncharacterized protein YkwD
MRFSRFRFEAAYLFAVVALAACGGGGGSSAGSSSGAAATNASGNNSIPAASAAPGSATLLAPAANAATLPGASGNATADGIAWLGTMRQNLGLPAVAIDSGLTTSSLDHATYLVENQAFGHTETQGNPGYTGADPMSRIEAAGNFAQVGEVVVAGQPTAFASSISPVQLLFDAPYHRIIMLDDFRWMGVGALQDASWEAFNIDFGNLAGAMPASSLVVYPYPGQRGAPTSWVANESPNPFANDTQYELTTVGYPVTIEGAFNATLSGVSFAMTDSSGNNVPCLAQTPQTMPDELSNGALCVPYSPLAANTIYTVHVTGVLTNAGQNQPIDVTWSFSTAVSGVANAATPVAPGSRPLPFF